MQGNRMLIVYLLSSIFLQSQEINFGVYDLYDRSPIKDVEAVSYDYKTFSDEDGQIRFFYKKTKKLTLNHINYTSITLFISQIKDSVFLESTHFKTDLTITADRIKLVQAGVSEVKSERVLLPKILIRKMPEINTAVKTLSQVTTTEDINGQNYINVMGSNDNEVRYFINGLNLFSYAEQRNYSSLVLSQLLKEVSLDIGSQDNYLAKLNLQVDQFIRPEISFSFGETEKSLRRNFVFNEGGLISITGLNYTNRLTENNIEDRFDNYKYNFFIDQFNLNEFLFYNETDLQISNKFLYEYRENLYLENISASDRTFTNGFNYKKNNWDFNFEVFGKTHDFKNRSDNNFLDFRESQSLQSNISLAKTFGDSISGLHTELDFLLLYENIERQNGLDLQNESSSDVQKSLSIKKKFIPEMKDSRELKTVLELDATLSEYKKEFFLKSASIKSALVLDLEPTVLDFYADINFGKVPLYNVNKMYLSSLNDTITDYLINKNMTFGVKFNYSRATLDLSYSIREYESYLAKIYGTIYNDFQIQTENAINSFNIKLDLKINKYTTANSSLMFTSSEDLTQFTNKPEFLQTHNLTVSYKNLDTQISYKNEKGKYLTYILNDIFYQREIEDSRDLSLFISYKDVFLENVKLSVSMTNLLKDKIYTLNGFYNNKRSFLGSLSYEF